MVRPRNVLLPLRRKAARRTLVQLRPDRFLRPASRSCQAHEVFQPIGFDAFGLPRKITPSKRAFTPRIPRKRILRPWSSSFTTSGRCLTGSAGGKTATRNIIAGRSGSFSSSIKKGLPIARRRSVNWCPSWRNVLANEQVVDGKCERCGEAVVRKDMTQWFLKITDYAEELLDGLSTLDWPEKTKLMQKNWIGKSTGCEVNFECETAIPLRYSPSRPDTLFGRRLRRPCPRASARSKN